MPVPLHHTSSTAPASWKGTAAELYPVVQDLTEEEYRGQGSSCCCPTVSTSESYESAQDFVDGSSTKGRTDTKNYGNPCPNSNNWCFSPFRANNTSTEVSLAQARRHQASLLDRCDSDASNGSSSHDAVASPFERQSFDTHYVLTQQIFRNGASQVWKCVQRETGHRYCVKMMEPRRLFLDDDDDPVLGEIAILQSLQPHKAFVVELIQVVHEPARTCLVMELLTGGNLLSLVIQQEGLPERVVRSILRSVLQGLVRIHEAGIWHNDLQASNILLDRGSNSSSCRSRYRAKIADFGRATWSGYMDLYRGGGGVGMSSSGGRHHRTVSYTAPELLFHGQSSAASDMWSVGVLLYFSLFAKLPFSDAHGRPELSRMERADYVIPSFAPGSSSSVTAAPAISSPLCPNAELSSSTSSSSSQGATISRGAKQLMSCLIHTDPSVRLTAAEALEHPWFQEQPLRVQIIDQKEQSRAGITASSTTPARRVSLFSRDRIGSLACRLMCRRPTYNCKNHDYDWKALESTTSTDATMATTHGPI